jgi:hypothetical protein
MTIHHYTETATPDATNLDILGGKQMVGQRIGYIRVSTIISM